MNYKVCYLQVERSFIGMWEVLFQRHTLLVGFGPSPHIQSLCVLFKWDSYKTDAYPWQSNTFRTCVRCWRAGELAIDSQCPMSSRREFCGAKWITTKEGPRSGVGRAFHVQAQDVIASMCITWAIKSITCMWNGRLYAQKCRSMQEVGFMEFYDYKINRKDTHFS